MSTGSQKTIDKFFEHFPKADPVHHPKQFEFFVKVFKWMVEEGRIKL